MSAIAGILRRNGRDVRAAEIDRMTRVLAHRGPHGRRGMNLGPVALINCLMRVQHEDWNEAQPLQDGPVTLVADLRLDNREELAASLDIPVANLSSVPDSEFLLAAYRRWGDDCVDHLIGDFAFAIWDAGRRRLLIGRDHMGQRALFYYMSDELLVFGSEIKAILAVEGVPHRVSERAIAERLLNPVDPTGVTTDFEDIHVLAGGATLSVTLGKPQHELRQYWVPTADSAHLGRNDDYYISAYRTILQEAVACRVRRSIAAPGLLLSGGFDSGAIAALGAPIVAAQGRSIVSVTSLLPPGESRPGRRDARHARDAFQDRPGLELSDYVRAPGETPLADLEQTFQDSDSATVTDYVRRGLYRALADRRCRLVLDGLGGDYTINVRAPGQIGLMIRRGQLGRFIGETIARRKLGRTWRGLWRNDILFGLLPIRGLAALQWLSRRGRPVWQTRPVNRDFAQALFDAGHIDPRRLRQPRPSYERWHARWVKLMRIAASRNPTETTIAARHGLDLTLPFHDKRVIEFGLAIPDRLRLREGHDRFLAQRALHDLLPERLLQGTLYNDAMEPDSFRAAHECAAANMKRLRAENSQGGISRYVDVERLHAMTTEVDETRLSDHRNLLTATRTIALSRFITWINRANTAQEP